MNDLDNPGLRIDQWLWFARFYKTRGRASTAVSGGHVKINGERAKPGSRVKPGDIIDLVRDKLPYRMEAGPLPLRRGPATEAKYCYREDAESEKMRQDIVAGIRQDRRQMPTTAGRPDKHTRRKLREHNRQRGDT
jgi:ribosome-associated heat shock protein Hsp15